MFAIIQTGAKQYKVEKGTVLDIERLDAEEGKTIKTENVLLVEDKGKTSIGTPLIKGATVSMKIVEHKRADKIKVYKMKSKKRYQKTQGHRQEITTIEITDIKVGSSSSAKKEA